jgi:HEAT repeat protein
MKSDNVWVRRAAAELMAEVATAKSIPALQEAAQSRDDDVAKAARAALGRIAPTQFDKTAEALMDLKGSDPWKKEAAFKALASGPADPKRRDEVAKALEDMFSGDRAPFDAENIGRALAVWHGPNTVTRLLPMVLDERGHPWVRKGLVIALAGTQDKRAVKPIMMWMLKEPDMVVEAISSMGPVAEAEVIARYNMAMSDKTKEGATVRANCVRMLQAVGHTPAAVATLTRAAGDRRDAAGAELAKSALETVKARVAQKAPPKPATKPAG